MGAAVLNDHGRRAGGVEDAMNDVVDNTNNIATWWMRPAGAECWQKQLKCYTQALLRL